MLHSIQIPVLTVVFKNKIALPLIVLVDIFPREANLGSHKNMYTNIRFSHSVTFDSL